MKLYKNFTLIILAFLGLLSKAQATLIDQNLVHKKFGKLENYSEYAAFNESIGKGDAMYCPLDRPESGCLVILQNEKYVFDQRLKLVKEVVWSTNDAGEQFVELKKVIGLKKRFWKFALKVLSEEKEKLSKSAKLSSKLSKNINKKNPLYTSRFYEFSIESAAPNGCGPANNQWVTMLADDTPFRSACDNHDACYASFTNKSWCDDNFLSEMKFIANFVADELKDDFGLSYYFIYGDIMTLGYAYYNLVKYFGLDSYCENKGPECYTKDGELGIVDFSNGVSINSGSGDGGTGALIPVDNYIPRNFNGYCSIPVFYKTCALRFCVPGTSYVVLPCP